MSAGKRPPGVMIYFSEMRPILSLMSDSERGQLLLAILDYGEHGIEPVLSDRLAPVWPFLKQKIDRDLESYKAKCERASKAAKSRWGVS